MTSSTNKQRVLVVHNTYQHRGGEDSVVEAEVELLNSRGHCVELYRRNNDDIHQLSKIRLAAQTIWSDRTTTEISQLIKKFAPNIIHVHNTLPLVSPSVYWAASKAKIPVVQTLHNFRLLCPQALMLRNGEICEDCVGKISLPAIRHACYRQRWYQPPYNFIDTLELGKTK
jgi:glycosyltransferase involved in cell wall biosynthesis